VNETSGGWETWTWDESLFAGAAAYYQQGRLPYAPGLAEAFARSLALDGQGRLLDVGWMDGPRVALAVAAMLDPGGAVVQVDAPGYRADELTADASRCPLPFPPPPDDAGDQLRRQYLGQDRRAGQGIRNTSPSGEDEVFQEASFLAAQTVTVPDNRVVERTIDDVVARFFSSSSTAPHLVGDRRPEFEGDLRKILAQASPEGRFCVRRPDNILRIWRLRDVSAG
jgi:hypothetical protein